MKQERLIKSLEVINRLIDMAETIPKFGRTTGKSAYMMAATGKALDVYKPLRYALNKAIKKPVRMDGSRAHCPDCGAGPRKSDNYCFRCGQRLGHEEPGKPYYLKIDYAKFKGGGNGSKRKH
jgi:hypothetical protein